MLESVVSITFASAASVKVSTVLSLAPDFIQLLIQGKTIAYLDCFILPVDSANGPACQVAYRLNALDLAIAEQEANLTITYFDQKLRRSGAKSVSILPLTAIIGDKYVGQTRAGAIEAVADLVCCHQQLRDAQNNVIASWYGALTWCSPKAGMVAANFYYTSPGAKRNKLFFRWQFHKESQKDKHLVVANYDVYTPDDAFSRTNSVEREIVKELIRQTSDRLCRRGAQRVSLELGPHQALSAETKEPSPYTTIKYWPGLHEYLEAMQNWQTTLADEELQSGTLVLDSKGLPAVVSGAFASVYRIKCGERQYAVRCFSTSVRDHAERYRRLSNFVCNDSLPHTIDFHFLEKGILIRGQWFPAVKMEWIEGESLGSFITRNLHSRKSLLTLRRTFWTMMLALGAEEVAHGDLQHGNIIVRGSNLFLIDYDGMYTPSLQGFRSKEKGHPAYQHPARGDSHFGPYLDNFSAWLIDTALLTLTIDPSFWTTFGEGDESLLFRRQDLIAPDQSKIFWQLSRHENRELNYRGEYLRKLLTWPPDSIPPLSPGYPDLLPDYDERATEASSGKIPDWMH
ncbi:MAG: hypothetical protein K2W95_05990 [Candidatus Obscuribacterales bacterium]|nr:hypothetical protein [Candidatus Obscuribacterales bacterium]